MSRHTNKFILFGAFIGGLVAPFIAYFTIIELFFLIIPYILIFFATLIYLIASLFVKTINTQKAMLAFAIIPTFLLSQFLSVFTINKIQRFRCEKLIKEVEKHKAETGNLPEEIKISFGIDYLKMKNNQDFIVSYSRGFMVTEKYESKYNRWKSYGWND